MLVYVSSSTYPSYVDQHTSKNSVFLRFEDVSVAVISSSLRRFLAGCVTRLVLSRHFEPLRTSNNHAHHLDSRWENCTCPVQFAEARNYRLALDREQKRVDQLKLKAFLAGQGRAGQGRAAQGRAGHWACSCTASLARGAHSALEPSAAWVAVPWNHD